MNVNNFSNSIKNAHLSEREVVEWLNQGQKDFEFNRDSELAKFYIQCIERLMNLYVKYRLDGFSKKESAEKINQKTITINNWLNRNDDEIFINFQEQIKDIGLKIAINALQNDLTLSEVASISNMSLNNLKSFIRCGERGDEKYAELYKVYQNKYLTKELDKFLVNLEKSKYKQALKSSLFNEDELNNYYIKGLQGDFAFKNFSDKFFNYKIEIYVKEILNKDKTPSKAARNAKLIDEDFKYREDKINKALIKKQFEIAMPYVEGGYFATHISKMIKIDVDEFFDWYIKGYDGDEFFKEFSESYWNNRMKDSIEEFQEIFDKGISENFFLDNYLNPDVIQEYKFWKSLDLFDYSKVKNDKKVNNQLFKDFMLSKFHSNRNIGENIEEDDEIDEDMDIDSVLSDFLNERGI